MRDSKGQTKNNFHNMTLKNKIIYLFIYQLIFEEIKLGIKMKIKFATNWLFNAAGL